MSMDFHRQAFQIGVNKTESSDRDEFDDAHRTRKTVLSKTIRDFAGPSSI
jgi:hypothetical protein